MAKLTQKVMIDSINKMAGQFGIPAISFADEKGKEVFGWKVPKPKSVRAKVHRIGGGFMFIKVGDRVRRTLVDDYGKDHPEDEGVIKQVTKDDSGIHIVMESGQFFSAGGIGNGWRREFEKVK